MAAITLRLTDEMMAFVHGAAEGEGYPDAEAFVQAVLMDEHSRRTARLHALLEEGLASGVSDRSIDDIFEDSCRRRRARQA
jgi:antitoxin ParD1/3/4